MQKVDWRKELKYLYGPSAREVVEIDVPEMRFLMLDGEGDPNGPRFAEATATLYALSYAAKFMVKKREGLDHAVSPLEGLWSDEGMGLFDIEDEEAWKQATADKRAWKWTLMVMQPQHISQEIVEEARAGVEKKKDLPMLSRVRFEPLHEGRAAQTMHCGPYADEWPTIDRVHRFIEQMGGIPSGRHHEIYLNQPGRTTPKNLKTIIRQPFVSAS